MIIKVKSFIRKILNNFLDFYFYKKSLSLLKKTENDISQINSKLLNVPFQFKGFGFYKIISPSQEMGEIKPFYHFIRKLKPKIVCEIGTDKGGTLYLWCKASHDKALIVSLDLPSRNNYTPKRRNFYSNFKKEKQDIRFVVGDSHKKETFDLLKKTLNGNLIDFLFIDGDHTYEGVKQDFYDYSKLVKKGGYIALHDIRTVRKDCGVSEFWNDLNKKLKRNNLKEFSVNDFGPAGAGIGLIKNE